MSVETQFVKSLIAFSRSWEIVDAFDPAVLGVLDRLFSIRLQ